MKNYKLRPQNYKLRVQNLQVWQLKLISYNFLKRCFECTFNSIFDQRDGEKDDVKMVKTTKYVV